VRDAHDISMSDIMSSIIPGILRLGNPASGWISIIWTTRRCCGWLSIISPGPDDGEGALALLLVIYQSDITLVDGRVSGTAPDGRHPGERSE